MKRDNDLDNFYKSRLEDATVTPPDEVWNSISARLPEKRSRVLPLWYKIAGAAAVAILLLGVGQAFFVPSPLPSANQTTYVPPITVYPEIELATEDFDKLMKESTTLLEAISEETARRRFLKNSSGTAADHEQPLSGDWHSPNPGEGTRTASAENRAAEDPSAGIAANPTATVPQSDAGNLSVSLTESSTPAENLLQEKMANKNGVQQYSNNETVLAGNESVENAASTQEFHEGTPHSGGTGASATSEGTASVSRPDQLPKEPFKGYSFDNQEELATSEEKVEENVGLLQTSEEPGFSAGENAVAAKWEDKKSMQNRLSISTKVAPVIFKAGGGNALDQQFSANKAAGEVSVSYGVSVAYRISPNIKLRSGVNRVALAYQTQDVGYNAAVNSAALESAPKTAVLASPMVGNLNQQMGFTEVPVEVEYLITDQRFGLSLLLGASSLFLDENNLTHDASTFSTDLGEANNLNEQSFSTNIGLGLNYKLAPQFHLNVEPMLKYQLNTFKSSSLRPYYFGIYSGFTFNF